MYTVLHKPRILKNKNKGGITMIHHRDLTQPLSLSGASGTGPIQTKYPEYRDYLPPCNHACPAGENIQHWLQLAQEGAFEEAWQSLIENNPLPAVHGRACYHPCENACNRNQVDEPVSIHAVERHLGELALRNGWQPRPPAPATGKKILVVGAGPSGLSCAWHLKRMGHEVEIRDAGPMPGGMMHFGIPAYRLPRAVLEQEIQRIVDYGVTLTLNHKVEDVLKEKAEGGFDAVFMAIGAHIGKRVDIPARDSGKILDAVSFLGSVDKGNPPKLGRRVAVYGGGNSAMDAARTAKRLGAEDAMIIYRRDEARMSAHAFEAEEAREEGVRINWLRTIKEMDEQSITVEIMRVNEHGELVGTGELETLEADSLILALGQEVDTQVLKAIPGLEHTDAGMVQVDRAMMTSVAGLFAGGDMIPAERSITQATGHGKKAARHIDAWLKGQTYQKPTQAPIIDYTGLHLWFNTDATSSKQPVTRPAERTQFDEIVGGLSDEAARYEAARCYSCGNCFECDGCYGACPEGAVIKLGKGSRYRFDYDKCTGCEACYNQCPCHAIDMVTPAESRPAESISLSEGFDQESAR